MLTRTANGLAPGREVIFVLLGLGKPSPSNPDVAVYKLLGYDELAEGGCRGSRATHVAPSGVIH